MHHDARAAAVGLIEHAPLSHEAIADFDEVIVVAGSRNFNDYDRFVRELEGYVLREHPGTSLIFVSGKARTGADDMTIRWCRENGLAWTEFPAKWDDLTVPGAVVRRNHRTGRDYNVVAGHQRNAEMANVMTKLVVFWDGKSTGTRNMIEEARRREIEPTIFLVDADKRVKDEKET
ncbi:SLOG family protein [Paraburkholderia sp. BCC1886]|uniref:SLOG family protein n=1 Tax=Paraburkholderia sp. BCC1886 TaxID=2562670 RepID=UPI001183C0CB|nr:SLOG family protein [Paraburkholderia sp. BCC1886]